jgi:hypothetical protein
VLEWIPQLSEPQKRLETKPCDANRFNAAMVIAAKCVLNQLPAKDTTSVGRQLYISALLFSSMLFMTAGYGEIISNSVMTDLIMFIQFVVYIITFVILFPQLPVKLCATRCVCEEAIPMHSSRLYGHVDISPLFRHSMWAGTQSVCGSSLALGRSQEPRLKPHHLTHPSGGMRSAR